MTKKQTAILFMVGSALVVVIPIAYKKFDIPADTSNTIIAYFVGMLSQMGVHKAVKMRKISKAKKEFAPKDTP